MKTELNDSRGTKTPRYAELAAKFRRKIEDGSWPPDSKIPSRRELADEYHVSIDVVKNACHMLFREHLLIMKPWKGTYVCLKISEEEIKKNLLSEPNYNYGKFPESEEVPDLPVKKSAIRLDQDSPEPDKWIFEEQKKCYPRQLPHLPDGSRSVKESLIEWIRPALAARGIVVDPRQVCITEGEFTILRNIVSVLRNHEGEFMVLPASFSRKVINMILFSGIEVKLIDSNTYTDFLDSLALLCSERRIKGVWLETRFDSGMGCMFPDDCRERLLDLAKTNRFPIIELDYGHEFTYMPFRPLFADAPGNVIYVSCISEWTNLLYDVKYAVGPLNFITSLRGLSEDCSRAAACRLIAVNNLLGKPAFKDVVKDRSEGCRNAALLLKKALCGMQNFNIEILLPSTGTCMYLIFSVKTDCSKLRRLLLENNIHIRRPVLKIIKGLKKKILRLNYSSINEDAVAFVAGQFITAFRKSSAPSL